MEKLEIKNGQAVYSTPDRELTQEQVMEVKASIQKSIADSESQIIYYQKQIDEAKIKLAECEAVCAELGY